MHDLPLQFKKQQEAFFSAVENPLPLLSLIDHLPATYFFAKNRDGHFMHVNRALREVLGLKQESDIIGMTDADFFLPEVAQRYREQDEQVMSSGQAITDHVCGVPNASGLLSWYVETKIPLFNHQEEVLGIAGIMHDLEKAGATLAPYQRLSKAISHVSDNYTDKISVETLAGLVHLSISQFNRTFKRLFRITPAQYILQVRINAACTLLRASSESIESIATQTGFFDASHFVKQFKKVMELTPNDYRKQWVSSVNSDIVQKNRTISSPGEL